MQVCADREPDTWITLYKRCLADGLLLLDPTEARKVKKNSSKYTLIDGDLYRFGFTHPLLDHGSARESWQSSTKVYAEATSGVELWPRELSVQATTGHL